MSDDLLYVKFSVTIALFAGKTTIELKTIIVERIACTTLNFAISCTGHCCISAWSRGGARQRIKYTRLVTGKVCWIYIQAILFQVKLWHCKIRCILHRTVSVKSLYLIEQLCHLERCHLVSEIDWTVLTGRVTILTISTAVPSILNFRVHEWLNRRTRFIFRKQRGSNCSHRANYFHIEN